MLKYETAGLSEGRFGHDKWTAGISYAKVNPTRLV